MSLSRVSSLVTLWIRDFSSLICKSEVYLVCSTFSSRFSLQMFSAVKEVHGVAAVQRACLSLPGIVITSMGKQVSDLVTGVGGFITFFALYCSLN
jgi:hypothetical protein